MTSNQSIHELHANGDEDYSLVLQLAAEELLIREQGHLNDFSSQALQNQLTAFASSAASLSTWATKWYDADQTQKDAIAIEIAKLLAVSKWNKQVITWSSPKSGSVKYVNAGEQSRFTPFTDLQISAVQQIFSYLSSITGISFVKATGDSSDINFGFGNIVMGGYANIPIADKSGDIRISERANVAGNFSAYGYSVLLHEIGHALGLTHPNEVGIGKDIDTRQASVMSYNNFYINDDQGIAKWTATYMPADIYALRAQYGNGKATTGVASYVFTSRSTSDYFFSAKSNAFEIDFGSPSYIFANSPSITIDLRGIFESAFVDLGLGALGSRGAVSAVQRDERPGASFLKTETVYAAGPTRPNTVSSDYIASTLISPQNHVETVWGTNSGDLLKGDSGDNKFYAGDGDDMILATAGSDFVDGGTGTDTLQFTDSITGYSIKRKSFSASSGSTFSIENKANKSLTLATNIESYLFSDSGLDLAGVFDLITGTNTPQSEIFRLYSAAFGRLPDAAGLSFWANAYTKGSSSYASISQSFLDSSEFKLLFGVNNTNSDFVVNLYKNILGRVPDASGLTYWVTTLDTGYSRANVLGNFSESTENKALFSQVTGLT